MSSNMLLNIRTQHPHDWAGNFGYRCCKQYHMGSHFAIIAKGNIIEGMEAKT